MQECSSYSTYSTKILEYMEHTFEYRAATAMSGDVKEEVKRFPILTNVEVVWLPRQT